MTKNISDTKKTARKALIKPSHELRRLAHGDDSDFSQQDGEDIERLPQKQRMRGLEVACNAHINKHPPLPALTLLTDALKRKDGVAGLRLGTMNSTDTTLHSNRGSMKLR